MELNNSQPRQRQLCQRCPNIGTQRCGRCQSVYYCSREHQAEHWSEHRKVCRSPANAASAQSRPLSSSSPAARKAAQQQAAMRQSMQQQHAVMQQQQHAVMQQQQHAVMQQQQHAVMQQQQQQHAVMAGAGPANFQAGSDHSLFSSLGSENLISDNNFWNLINHCQAQNLFDKDCSHCEIEKISSSLLEQQPEADPNSLMGGQDFRTICRTIIHDMNNFGICVLDKFVGNKMGTAVFNDVQRLYSKGIFTQGKLVNNDPCLVENTVRSDLTTWLIGTEQEYPNIASLISQLDKVVTTCNKMPDNGQLSNYKLHRRTKAMIACYPGNGTYYKRHVDNPYKDGRCITCIYYLNQNWDLKQQGGLLRMFPTSHATQMVDIEPIFDRMIFFWSDKRNPHEVRPAYATRFAITVWYFDADERKEALKTMAKEQPQKTNPPA